MRFLHFDLSAGPNDIVEVTLDARANVRLLDDSNFWAYRDGRAHRHFGGYAESSPVHLVPPHHGHWHLVVDLGGYAGQVRAGVRVIGDG